MSRHQQQLIASQPQQPRRDTDTVYCPIDMYTASNEVGSSSSTGLHRFKQNWRKTTFEKFLHPILKATTNTRQNIRDFSKKSRRTNGEHQFYNQQQQLYCANLRFIIGNRATSVGRIAGKHCCVWPPIKINNKHRQSSSR